MIADIYWPGTDSPMDYVSRVDADGVPMNISMNNIGRFRGFRFTQAGYDDDMKGSRLGVLHDPWGIALTYSGYAMLLLSMLLLLAGRSSQIRTWYRKALEGNGLKTAALALLLVPFSSRAEGGAPRGIDPAVSEAFGDIAVLYGGRICPVSTVAADFVTKLSGKDSWNGCPAEQIFAGWTFDSARWERVPMILIKDNAARKALGISGKWASYDDFWNSLNVYKLKAPMEKALKDADASALKHLRDADEKFNLIRMFYNGELLRMFPYVSGNGSVSWMAPGQQSVEMDLPAGEWNFVRRAMDYLTAFGMI